ncbi:hypothetical protein [Erwinia tasmaniensis]|nr:hypothetical protein [Erwinia tasmaniensis]
MTHVNATVFPTISLPNLDHDVPRHLKQNQINITEDIFKFLDENSYPDAENRPELSSPIQKKTSANNININNVRSPTKSRVNTRDIDSLELIAKSRGDDFSLEIAKLSTEVIKPPRSSQAPLPRSSSFKNMFGDLGMLSVSNLVVHMTNIERTVFNVLSSESIRRMVTTAVNAGQHVIAAAKQNFSGAIVSGIVGSGVQVASGATMCKAIKKEHNSIEGNLKAANVKNAAAQENQVSITKNLQQQHKDGKTPDDEMVMKMARSHTKLHEEAANHQIDHQKIVNKTYQIRAKTDLVNQVNHAGQQTVVAGFAVNAAAETNQAEVLKSGQQVHHEISDNHKQKAKSAEDTQAAINQFVDAWIANNNSAVSSIAGR